MNKTWYEEVEEKYRNNIKDNETLIIALEILEESLTLIEENNQLKQENEQLKKELQKADSLTQSCIFEGKEESELNFRKAINIIKELRSWLEEQKQDRYWKNDAYRYTAYENVLNKLNELEGKNE